MNSRFLWLCLMDDVQQICNNPASPLARLLHYTRAYDLSFFISVQNRLVTDSLLSNCGTKFVGRINDGDEWDFFGRHVGLLDYAQKQWLAEKLVPGRFLASIPDGWNMPFLFQVVDPQLPPLGYDPVEKQPAPDRSVLGTQLVYCEEHRNWSPFAKQQQRKERTAAAESPPDALTEKDYDYLAAVHRQPEGNFSFYISYFRNHGIRINQTQGKKIREKLQRLGLLQIVEVQGRDGRASMTHFPTPTGEQALRDHRQKNTVPPDGTDA